ncbi:glutaredoxin [Strongylocentrotus purpuratus]|uniref:Glutaredoxin-2, mitochondrial n=1 Tax=Strongylocentrotus purpuratus TaxID=7668 RepID=A0A7M7G401_STRPU|nr:glutaredoxin [Strongylocentrotus purpuratus]|eukprot:XP_001197806.2 PREDICTED: glutaredoxin [Strongylocentrotus purpuratus]
MGHLFSSEAVNMEGKEATYIKGITHDKCVVVFSKTHCPFCHKVKTIFEDFGASYEVVEMDKRSDTSAMQAVLGKMTGASTVPRVFIQGKCVGGYDDTKRLQDSGRLEEMLRDCNAIE